MSALAWTTAAQATAQRRYWRQSAVAYLYLAPALILLTLFHFFPAVYGFYISLWRWGIVQERFVALENYQRVLVDEAFWKSLGTTVWYVILVIPAEMAIGLGV